MLLILYYRQLLKDYNSRLPYAFVMAADMITEIICRKEDAVANDEVSFEDANADVVNEKMDALRRRMFENEPQIKAVLAGTFMELVDKGLIEL